MKFGVEKIVTLLLIYPCVMTHLESEKKQHSPNESYTGFFCRTVAVAHLYQIHTVPVL